MPEPIFDDTTEAMYARLPEHFRRMDTASYALKKYIAGIASILDKTNILIDRFSYTPLDEGGEPGDTSDLVDPHTADLEWLPWLAQLLGVNIGNQPVNETSRNEVINASNGYLAGTPDAIISAVQTELIGTKSVRLKKRTTESGTGGAWDLLIQTLKSETLTNLLPEYYSIPLATASWTLAPGGGVATIKNVVDSRFFSNRAAEFRIIGGTPTVEAYVYLGETYPILATEPATFVIDSVYTEGNAASLYMQAGLACYTSGDVFISNVTSAGGTFAKNVVTTHIVASTSLPATTAKVRPYLYAPSTTDANYALRFGHLALRREADTLWIPRSADPVRAVTERGAKPAGLKLWHTNMVSSWENIEDGGDTTWDDVDGGDWTEFEEYEG